MAGRLSVITMILTLLFTSSSVNAAAMTIKKALSEIRESGTLTSQQTEPVIVEKTLELSKIVSDPGVVKTKGLLVFRNIDFKGGINAAGLTVPFELRFENCRLAFLDARKTSWKGRLTFVDSPSVRNVYFIDGRLEDGIVARNSKFVGPMFRHMVFVGKTEWLGGELANSVFISSRFKSVTHFDNATFSGTTKFLSTTFERDVSFVKANSKSRILFNRIAFLGDVEFRLCNFADVSFGAPDVTLFSGFSDFRKCVFGKTDFSFAVFRGDAVFTDARMKGDVSFANTIFRGEVATIEGVQFENSLEMTMSSASSLRYYWDDIGPALMLTVPDWRVLSAVEKRLSDLGLREGALDASYHLAETRRKEMLASNTSLTKKIQIVTEWLIWGLPTGYGTKLGRIIVVSLACWLFAAVLCVLFNAPLYRIAREQTETGFDHPMFRPADIDIPEMKLASRIPIFERWFLALAFMLGIFFKIRMRSLVYVEARARVSGFYAWEMFFFSTWVLGAVLLTLITITLANTSPIISRLVGSIAF